MKLIRTNNILRMALLIAIMVATSLRASAQVAELEKYADEKGTSYVYVSRMMLSMASRFGQSKVGNVKIGKLIGKLHCIQVISAEKAATAKMLANDVMRITKHNGYELMMQADDADDKTRIYYKEATSKKNNSVVIIFTYDSSDCSVVALSGKFTQEDLQSLGDM